MAVVGPSGAGKSSLAFATLYAEGQRRYVESFSAYARQFLERLARPDVDELDPIAATVAVDRQAPVRTSRSTVGTMTEVADYAKSLWARAASLECPGCGRTVTRDEPEAIADELLATGDEPRVVVTYPLEVAGAESFLGVREALVGEGYRRLSSTERSWTSTRCRRAASRARAGSTSSRTGSSRAPPTARASSSPSRRRWRGAAGGSTSRSRAPAPSGTRAGSTAPTATSPTATPRRGCSRSTARSAPARPAAASGGRSASTGSACSTSRTARSRAA